MRNMRRDVWVKKEFRFLREPRLVVCFLRLGVGRFDFRIVESQKWFTSSLRLAIDQFGFFLLLVFPTLNKTFIDQ
jgi:hypothetical protein